MSSLELPGRSDLNLLKAHKNIHLINDKKCGNSIVSNRIIGGEIKNLMFDVR